MLCGATPVADAGAFCGAVHHTLLHLVTWQPALETHLKTNKLDQMFVSIISMISTKQVKVNSCKMRAGVRKNGGKYQKKLNI